MKGQKITSVWQSYEATGVVIDSSARKIVENGKGRRHQLVSPVPLPTGKNVYCVIRSPHRSTRTAASAEEMRRGV